MRRAQPHQHPCATAGCPRVVVCHGELVENYDGWPEVICAVYHEQQIRPLCETCAEAAA